MKKVSAAVSALIAALAFSGCFGGEESSSQTESFVSTAQTSASQHESEFSQAGGQPAESAESVPSVGVSLSKEDFDAERSYSSDNFEFTDLSKLDCDISSIVFVLDPVQLGYTVQAKTEIVGAHGGNVYFSICDSASAQGGVIEVVCASGAVTENIRIAYLDSFEVKYADSDCFIFTMDGASYVNYISEDVKEIKEILAVKEGGNFCRIGNSLYYDIEPVGIAKLDLVSRSVKVEKTTATGASMHSGTFSYEDYSADNNKVYGGIYDMFVSELNDKSFFGSRYMIGYMKAYHSREGIPVFTSEYGVRPYDPHITMTRLMAFSTESVYSANTSPVLVDIDSGLAAVVSGLTDDCIVINDYYRVYFTERLLTENISYRIICAEKK